MIGYIENLIKEIKEGRYNKIEAAHLFEEAVLGADKDCAPHIASGNKNYPNLLNKLLLELREAINTQFNVVPVEESYFEEAIKNEAGS